MNVPVVKFQPSGKQYEAYNRLTDARTAFVGYGGSAYSGKSYLLCYWLLIMCLAYPGTGWGLGRRALTVLKKTTLLTLFKVFEESNVKTGRDFNYNQQLNLITFTNGSQIFLIDTEYAPSDPLFTRFGGFELTGAGVDESPETTEMAIQILSTRIGRRLNGKYNLPAKLLETFNPDKGHVYERYYKPWRDKLLPAEYAFIKALPSDNPAPDVGPYIQRLLATGDKVLIERLIYGNFEYDDDPQKLFTYDKILELFTNEFVAPGRERFLTADIAYEGSDLFVMMAWEGLVVIDIEAIDKCDEVVVARKIQEFRMKHAVPLGNVIYDADGLKTFVRHSAAVGSLAGAKQFHNGGKALYGENYYNLKAQCYWKLSELTDANKIHIRPKAFRKQIIEELEQIRKLVRNDDTEALRLEKKSVLRERFGRSPDFSDALMMRMLPELRPKPKTNDTLNSYLALR